MSDEALARLSWVGGIPLLIVMIILTAIFGGREFLVGVCAGGFAIILIHAGVYRSLKNILSGAADGQQKDAFAVVLGFLLRLLVSGAILAGLLLYGWAHPFGIALGASVVLINNLFLAAILATRKKHTELGSS
ncbi:MAG: ATP synthase subunit I [Deltaproteobacteria bacterium]|nr:ATP synthase subunit I [Candidatus Zymogenaceae bacterium]